ncbi:RNA polymerase sigma factor [Streptomyces sp. NBC_00038]|uniref:RNA polymerase sigma factor n=1 Tax=Streptomyces sp. NBC_00038 TaxID=2903615 RepID=UPI00224F78BD|nr:sigma-70 family RNA polymerase sigma factor [Streptomyces sp. NBC_00038]MCX5559295.1 sigma-70 family RNA polymerase sigma factor [Streptomyces sp. NBC_00038]
MDNVTQPPAESSPIALVAARQAVATTESARVSQPSNATSRAAFAHCYQQQLTPVIRFTMRNGASPHEAADIAQSTFVLAYEAWHAIDHPPAWLRRVAFRQLLKLRQAKEHPCATVPDLPGGRCPMSAVELGEQEARVFEALGWLPPRQREVMAWTVDGFTPTEIAHELAITPDAVRQSLARARQNLKRALGISKGGAR